MTASSDLTSVARVLLVGAGGYGQKYAQQLLDLEADGTARIGAVIDPTGAQRAEGHPLVDRTDLAAFDDLQTAIDADAGDVVVIASPIAFHAEQLVSAATAGLPVLVEKPLCAGKEDLAHCLAAADQATSAIHVGFQLSYHPSMRTLKRRVLAGDFGAPLRCTVAASWPRDHRYYARNNWAGRLQDDHGRWVLDSPANNACAHFLFNCLWLLGAEESSAAPLTLENVQLARAFDIESCDTVYLRGRAGDAEIAYAVTHADPQQNGPILHYHFEQAHISLDWPNGITITRNDGQRDELPSPCHDHSHKLLHLIDPAAPVCASIAAASEHSAVINAMHAEPIHAFDPARIRQEEHRVSVDGLGAALQAAVEAGEPLPTTWFASH